MGLEDFMGFTTWEDEYNLLGDDTKQVCKLLGIPTFRSNLLLKTNTADPPQRRRLHGGTPGTTF
jgi:hypothetical protein